MSKVLIQIQKQIPVSIDTDVFIGKHRVIIDEAVICNGLTDIKGRIDSKPIPQTKEVEWVNGLPPVGVECVFTPHNMQWGFNHIEDFAGTVLHYEGEQFVFMLNHTKYKLEGEMVVVSRTDKGDFTKPETEAERIEREELENGEALFNFSEESAEKAGGIMLSAPWEDQTQASKDYWVMFAKQLGYRKESE